MARATTTSAPSYYYGTRLDRVPQIPCSIHPRAIRVLVQERHLVHEIDFVTNYWAHFKRCHVSGSSATAGTATKSLHIEMQNPTKSQPFLLRTNHIYRTTFSAASCRRVMHKMHRRPHRRSSQAAATRSCRQLERRSSWTNQYGS